MAKEIEPEDTDKKKSGESKKLPFKLLILAVLVIALGAGGYFAWGFFKKGKAPEGDGSAPPDHPKDKAGEVLVIHPLDSFIVNLMDKSGLSNRYLKVTISLEITGEKTRKILEENNPRLRDAILLLLSSQSFDEINTPDGKIALKQELLYRVNQVLNGNIVKKIYFTEFVVQ
ncbi:MAG: flagellar basal body-associated FliL family protein [Deltaproteobacteria bacterium]|nr:flagellar basal body-associated FliL family protein [Deltaproteobacteria bacterium]